MRSRGIPSRKKSSLKSTTTRPRSIVTQSPKDRKVSTQGFPWTRSEAVPVPRRRGPNPWPSSQGASGEVCSPRLSLFRKWSALTTIPGRRNGPSRPLWPWLRQEGLLGLTFFIVCIMLHSPPHGRLAYPRNNNVLLLTCTGCLLTISTSRLGGHGDLFRH